MPTVTFLPTPVGSGAGGDVTFRTDVSQTIALPSAGSTLRAGKVASGKSSNSYGLMLRFDLSSIPAGATINGARVTLYDAGSVSGSNPNYRTGWMAKDAEWDSGDGFGHANYVNFNDLPRVYTVAHQAAVMFDSRSRLTTLNLAGIGIGDPVTIGGGTLSSLANVALLHSDLENFLATEGSIVGFQFACNVTGNNTALLARDEGHATLKPFLEVDYVLAPVVIISAPSDPTTEDFGTEITFTATAIDDLDGDISAGIGWSSSIDGSMGTGASIDVDDLTVGVHVITASRTDSEGETGTDTVGVTIENTAPVVTITSPADAQSFSMGVEITFIGTAIDDVDGDISSGIGWTSDVDGALGTGASIAVDDLTVGAHVITADRTDSGSLEGTDTIDLTITNVAPVVIISSPPGATLVSNIFATETFTATAIDLEDGDLSSAIVWTSSVDGSLGTGASINVVMNTLTLGAHTITATSTDSGSLQGTDTFVLTIQDVMSIDRSQATLKPTFAARAGTADTFTARAAITAQTFAARGSTMATFTARATIKPTFTARASIK